MKTYKVQDDRGNTIEISEVQMYRHIKLIFAPILSQLGYDAGDIAKYDGDIYRLVGAVIGQIKQLQSTIDIARKHYVTIKRQRDQVFAFIETFMGHRLESTPGDVVNLNDRRKAA